MGSLKIIEQKNLLKVCGAGIALLLVFVVIFAISQPFEYNSDLPRPILTVTGLLFLASLIAFYGLGVALRCNESRQMLVVIIAFAISLRLVALFTCPILEIDYYRYLWDGKAIAHGVSPYEFSPAQIIQQDSQPDFEFADAKTDSPKKSLSNSVYQKLLALSVETESNNTILNRIHFSEYSTIYPPVSQAVFGLAMKWFPSNSSVEAHIVFIKAVLMLFDLLTLTLVVMMLRQLKFHAAWLIAYAWNPLVIKEIANGGHLDSIATFFLMLSITCLTSWLLKTHQKKTWSLPVMSGLALGIGFGAKLFPIVLFPALMITIARFRWSTALLFATVFVAAAGVSVYPMYHSLHNDQTSKTELAPIEHQQREQLGSSTPNRGPSTSGDLAAKKKEGLTGFFSKWRMNDVIFSGIYLNLKPATSENVNSPWYVFTSQEFRQSVKRSCESLSFAGANPAFTLTRLLTLGLFSLFYLWQLIAIYQGPRNDKEHDSSTEQNSPIPIEFERLVWVMAVFLFLQPTVNPWYWVWIAPLTVFSRNRNWLIVAGLLLTYYSRFWFKSISDSFSIAGYSGVGLFDHGIAWIELGAIAAVIFLFKAHKKAADRLDSISR